MKWLLSTFTTFSLSLQTFCVHQGSIISPFVFIVNLLLRGAWAKNNLSYNGLMKVWLKKYCVCSEGRRYSELRTWADCGPFCADVVYGRPWKWIFQNWWPTCIIWNFFRVLACIGSMLWGVADILQMVDLSFVVPRSSLLFAAAVSVCPILNYFI